MLYIIYQEDRDDGAEIRASNKDEHFAYLDRHQDILLLGGALLGDDGVKRTGSCLIINVPSREQAEPAVQERKDRAHASRPMESGGRAKDSGGELSLAGIHLVQDIHVLRGIRPARTGGHWRFRFREQSGHGLRTATHLPPSGGQFCRDAQRAVWAPPFRFAKLMPLGIRAIAAGTPRGRMR